MARKFSKKSSKKTKIKLSPKQADEIIRQEFTDRKGNKMNILLDIKPKKPNEPIIEWNRQYKE